MTDQDLRAQIAALKADNDSLLDALNMERRANQERRVLPADIVNKLKSLKDLANKACDAAFQSEDCRGDVVNWGDLSCVGASWSIDDDGEVIFTVYLEEADPGCTELKVFVSEWLAKAGWANVDVRAEW